MYIAAQKYSIAVHVYCCTKVQYCLYMYIAPSKPDVRYIRYYYAIKVLYDIIMFISNCH